MTSTYLPAAQIILDISQANPALVTTAVNHGYQDGLYVDIIIPYPGSMEQVNGNTYLIFNASGNTFNIPVNSTHFDEFTTAPLLAGQFSQQAQSIPVAEVNSSLSQATENIGPNNPRTF